MKHWQPDAEVDLRPPKGRGKRGRRELAHWATVDRYEAAPLPKRKGELTGAVAGLALVAAACIGICALLYQLSGPRDTFAEIETLAD